MENYEEESEEARPDLSEVFERCMDGFRASQEPTNEYREESLNDRKFTFVHGAQWSGKWYEQFENKPKLEINKVLPAVIKHTNEYLNNKISADFVPEDGEDADDLADTLDGLYRSDKANGGAQAAYDNGYLDGASGGYGAWVLVDEYEDEYDPDNECQKICWKPIYDADKCVYFSANAKEYDKSDADEAWWLQPLSRKKFEKEFPDEDPSSWSPTVNAYGFDWVTPDVVWIANYYETEYIDDELVVYVSPEGVEETYSTEDFEFDDELENKLLYTGYKEIKRKLHKKKRIHKYIVSGEKVLEDCGFISGPNIPIVPMYGMRFIVDGVEYCIGETRHLRDPQMIINGNYSKISEISATSPIERPIFDPKQVDGPLYDEWRDMNTKNYPIARAKVLYDPNGNAVQVGPLGYVKPPSIPPTTAALMQMIQTDLREISGGDDQGEMVRSHISGDAIERVQNKISMASFMPLSNMGKSTKRDAEIWMGKAKEIYIEKGRKLRSMGKTNESSTVELMKPEMKDGKLVYKNDLRKAKCKVTIEIGPSTTSKRKAVLSGIMEMMNYTQDEQDLKVLTATAFMNMEGEGLQDIREYYRMSLLRMGVGKPTDKEQEILNAEKQSQQPNPQEEFLKSEAAKNMAKIEESKADVVKTYAEADKTRADTLDTLSQIDREERQQAIENANLINQPQAETGVINGQGNQ